MEKTPKTHSSSGIRYLKEDYFNEMLGKTSYLLKIWKPNAKKNYEHYRFYTTQERTDFLNKRIKSQLTHIKRREEEKKLRKKSGSEYIKRINVGDIFSTSWGYDQTNYDYICIIEKKNKTVICKRTSSIHLGEDGQTNVQTPIFQPFGDKFIMQVRDNHLVGSYPFCQDGTGSRRRGYFTKCEQLVSTFKETMLGYGH